MLLQKLIHVSLFALLSQPCCKGIFVRAQQRWGWPGVAVAMGPSGQWGAPSPQPVRWAGLGWAGLGMVAEVTHSPAIPRHWLQAWAQLGGQPLDQDRRGPGWSLAEWGPRARPELAANSAWDHSHPAPGLAPRVVPVAAGLPSYSIKCSCNCHLTAVPSPL